MIPDSVHLLTRSSQMTLYKDEQGRVRRAYYGPRLREPEDALENAADAPLLYSSLADSVTGLPNASGEYCICVTQADGALSLSLECLGWEVLELDDDREEAVFYGKDPSYPVRVEIHVRSHRESDTFLQWAVIRNEGKEGIRLHRAASAQLGLRAERYFVTSFRGTWGGESIMSEEEVARGHELALVSGTGTRTAQEGSPGFIISLDGPAREDSGEVVLGALAWSGNYRIWFRHSPYHYLLPERGWIWLPRPICWTAAVCSRHRPSFWRTVKRQGRGLPAHPPLGAPLRPAWWRIREADLAEFLGGGVFYLYGKSAARHDETCGRLGDRAFRAG